MSVLLNELGRRSHLKRGTDAHQWRRFMNLLVSSRRSLLTGAAAGLAVAASSKLPTAHAAGGVCLGKSVKVALRRGGGTVRRKAPRTRQPAGNDQSCAGGAQGQEFRFIQLDWLHHFPRRLSPIRIRQSPI